MPFAAGLVILNPTAATRPSPTAPSKSAFDSAMAILALHRQVSAARDFPGITDTLCLRIATLLKATRVSVGWIRNGQCDVVACSDGPLHGLDKLLRTALAQAMAESVAQQVSLSSINPDGPLRIVAAQRVLARRSGGFVATVPIAIDTISLGALTIELSARRLAKTEEQTVARTRSLIRLIEQMLAPLARLLQLAARDNQPVWRTWVQRLVLAHGERRQGLVRPRYMRDAAIALAVVFVIVLLIPFQQSITSVARLEGAVERQVDVFEAGQIESVQVRPGDVVQADQLLATLGRREVELELDQARSEITQLRSEADAAMAIGDRSRMAGAQARMDQLAAGAKLLELRLTRTEIRAPIAGTVLSGDHSQRIDAPVARGETLFTIAPNDSLRVIAEVDETEAGAVQIGQTGELSVAALPWQRFAVSVTRIAPMAAVVNNRNVVEVQTALVNAPLGLKPGQRGAVHLQGIHQNLARRWFGQLLDGAARLWWRWRPW